MNLSTDCREFIALLRSESVDFLIVGAAALAAHGRPRYSGDVDFWIRCDEDTASKMERVIQKFGFASTKLTAQDFATPDKESFRRNKAALGRNKDLADIEDLV